MQKLVIILLAFLALFTFIRAFDTAEAGEIPQEKTVEIVR